MKRDPLEIIKEIFRLLEQEGSALSINQIAQKTGMHNITVKRYIKLINILSSRDIVEYCRRMFGSKIPIISCASSSKYYRGQSLIRRLINNVEQKHPGMARALQCSAEKLSRILKGNNA